MVDDIAGWCEMQHRAPELEMPMLNSSAPKFSKSGAHRWMLIQCFTRLILGELQDSGGLIPRRAA
jgi:hypothetical protein